MPQMAPIWWFTMFLMFILTYCIFMMMFYFYNIYKMNIKPQNNTLNTKNINWKW